MSLHAPTTPAELAAIVADAFRAKTPIAIRGGGTRAGLGRPVQAAATLSTAGLTGITLHEPAELVVSARAGTPVSEVVAALAAKGQRLPFEPMDHRALYGTTGEATVGGLAMGNISGPARIAFGAARDSMIGLYFVNGRGEDVKSGGRVMKNVTGLDFVKALAGSHGTLAVAHEITFKVLPLPERERTLVLTGLSDARAVEALAAALGSPFEPTGAAHLPGARLTDNRTVLRIEGPPTSILYRTDKLVALLRPFGPIELLEGDEAARLWLSIRDAAPVASGDGAVWRLSLPPSKGPAVGEALRAIGASLLYDWGGGLVWAALPAGAEPQAPMVHALTKSAGGHATLVRAPEGVRAAVDVFDPPAPALMAIQKKLKASFDPAGVLNPGRMYAGV